MHTLYSFLRTLQLKVGEGTFRNVMLNVMLLIKESASVTTEIKYKHTL